MQGVLSSEGEPDQKVRGASMIAAYETLLKSPRWEKNNGMDFVFYDSHTGFGVNDSGIPLDDFLCGEFRNSTILTTVIQFLNACLAAWQLRILRIGSLSYCFDGNLASKISLDEQCQPDYLEFLDFVGVERRIVNSGHGPARSSNFQHCPPTASWSYRASLPASKIVDAPDHEG